MELKELLNIQIVKKVRYLGIQMSARCSSLKEDNYIKVKKQIEKDLEKWKTLQLSLMGRIALIKMNILPRLIFLFSTIPIKMDKAFFNDMNKITTKFIWQGKRPRISLKMLQDVRMRGGFGLPNWEIYYQATVMTWIKEWIVLRNKRLMMLEGHDLQIGWHTFVWYEKQKIHGYFQRHSIRNSLFAIWTKLKNKHYIKVPFWISPTEALTHPSRIDWNNIVRYNDIIAQTKKLKSMEELDKQGIKIDWYRYIQLQAGYDKDLKTKGINFQKTKLDEIIFGSDENLITKIYNYLLTTELDSEKIKATMIKWTRNIGHTIDTDMWQQLWERNYKMTMSTAFKENMYKMFYRWHTSPERLAKMFKNSSMKCWKCGCVPGSFYHMWWTCTEARRFWKEIQHWIEKILKRTIELKPEIFLLGILPENFNREEIYLIVHIVTAARIVYAQNWKLNRIPTEREITRKIMDCAEMNRLTLRLKDKEDSEYFRIWGKFYEWMEAKNS